MTPKEWEARNYRDHDRGRTRIDWADDVERLAVALRAMTYLPAADVAGMVSGKAGRSELGQTWIAMQPPDRQVWRRRAATAIGIMAGDVVALGSDVRAADGAMR